MILQNEKQRNGEKFMYYKASLKYFLSILNILMKNGCDFKAQKKLLADVKDFMYTFSYLNKLSNLGVQTSFMTKSELIYAIPLFCFILIWSEEEKNSKVAKEIFLESPELNKLFTLVTVFERVELGKYNKGEFFKIKSDLFNLYIGKGSEELRIKKAAYLELFIPTNFEVSLKDAKKLTEQDLEFIYNAIFFVTVISKITEQSSYFPNWEEFSKKIKNSIAKLGILSVQSNYGSIDFEETAIEKLLLIKSHSLENQIFDNFRKLWLVKEKLIKSHSLENQIFDNFRKLWLVKEKLQIFDNCRNYGWRIFTYDE